MTFGQNAVSRPERYEDQHLEVDFKTSSAWLDSHPIILTRKEYALLSLLVQNAGEIVPRDALPCGESGATVRRSAPVRSTCISAGFGGS